MTVYFVDFYEADYDPNRFAGVVVYKDIRTMFNRFERLSVSGALQRVRIITLCTSNFDGDFHMIYSPNINPVEVKEYESLFDALLEYDIRFTLE